MHHEKCGRNDPSTIKCGPIERLMYQAEKPHRMSDSTMIRGESRVRRMTGSHQLKPIVTGQAGRVGKEGNTWVMSSAPLVARLSLRHDLFVFCNQWDGITWKSWW